MNFTEYDSSRIKMFRLFLEYEKKMLPDNLDKEDSIFLEAINNDKINSDNDKEMLRAVRNAFCHNEYPARANEKLTMPLYDNKLPGIAKSLYEKVEAIVDKVC